MSYQPPHPSPEEISGRRKGRIAFGVLLSATVFALPLASLATSSPGLRSATGIPRGIFATQVLGALWLAAIAAYLLFRWLPVVTIRRGRRSGSATPAGAMSAFDATGTAADRLAKASFVAPAVGAGFVGPLTLHALLALPMGSLGEFDFWINASVVMVWHAHIAFAIVLGARASRLVAEPASLSVSRGAAKAVIVATVVGAIPGVAFAGIPPALVFITGAVIAPVVLAWLRTVALHEELALRSAGDVRPLGYTDVRGTIAAAA